MCIRDRHNTLCPCLVLAITGSLKVFDLPWTMFVGGLPVDKSWLTGTYMYYQTMGLQDLDYGSAIAILIVVLGVVILSLIHICGCLWPALRHGHHGQPQPGRLQRHQGVYGGRARRGRNAYRRLGGL